MSITQPDIIVKSSQGITTLWLREDWLLQKLDSLGKTYLEVKARAEYKKSVSKCHHSKTFLPDTGISWRWAKANGTFYYCYDNIPDKAPTNYKSSLPTKEELIELEKTAKKKETITPLETFLTPFVKENYERFLPCYGDCTRQQQLNLAKAASFVSASIVWFIDNNISKKDGSFFRMLSDIATKLDVKYLPLHYRNLQKLICETILNEGKVVTDTIKLPRVGNKNAATHSNDTEIADWIYTYRKHGKNFTNSHIIRKIYMACAMFDKPKPSPRWIGTQMEEVNLKFLTAETRFGVSSKYAQSYRGYTPMGNPMFAGDCWQCDGTRINMLGFKKSVIVKDAEGNDMTVSREAFLTLVAVRDAYSGDVLGYSFNLSENRWTYIQAIKMAVEEAEYLPYEMVFDRFPGHNSPEGIAFLEDLRNRGVKVTITHKAEGKAKIERWIGTLQTVFMQDSNYYYGEGIKSRNIHAHRSQEYLQELRKTANKDGWNWDTACDEAAKTIEAYRSTKYSSYSRKYADIDLSPSDMHTESEKPNTITIEQHQFAYLFGFKRKEKMSNMGLIDFEADKVVYKYRCADYDVVSKYDNTQVLISYSPEAMGSIHIYELSDSPIKKYLGVANEITTVIPYGPEAFKTYGKDEAILISLQQQKQEEIARKAVGCDIMSLLEKGVDKQTYGEAETAATMTHIFGTMDEDNPDLSNYDITEQY